MSDIWNPYSRKDFIASNAHTFSSGIKELRCYKCNILFAYPNLSSSSNLSSFSAQVLSEKELKQIDKITFLPHLLS